MYDNVDRISSIICSVFHNPLIVYIVMHVTSLLETAHKTFQFIKFINVYHYREI